MENDTTKSYFSPSFRFHSTSIPFPAILSEEMLFHSPPEAKPWRARIVSNRERPDLTASLVIGNVSIHYQKSIKILVPGEVHVDAARNRTFGLGCFVTCCDISGYELVIKGPTDNAARNLPWPWPYFLPMTRTKSTALLSGEQAS